MSFGDQAAEIPLHDLNVVIGPNGSGKSNLLEAIDVGYHVIIFQKGAILCSEPARY
ncbi:AAA family ATPase [Thiolapillus sp.]|uniref:AAA family ATPase n=1 Tax=Thiolapillus sp. TaxID=2017437 RepID=UPI003AF90FD6